MPLSKVPAAALASGAAKENFGAGAVLQVVNAVRTTNLSTSSSTYVTVLSATITPKNANNKLLVSAFIAGVYHEGSVNAWLRAMLLKDGVEQYCIEGGQGYSLPVSGYSGGTGQEVLFTAGTTSAVTFAVAVRNEGGAGTVGICANSAVSSLTITEIAG